MNYLLLGYGISNKSIYNNINNIINNVIIYDDKLMNKPINLHNISCIIKSGSIPNDHKIINEAKDLNIPIYSDIELFYQLYHPNSLITVTGTNGKTTTVNYIKTLIPQYSLAGNIGKAIFDYHNNPNNLIIEASSFMLEYIDKYHSSCSILLNISCNHLEHHKTMNQYIKSKFKLLKNNTNNDLIIYSLDDKIITNLIKYYQGIKIPFSLSQENKGFYIKNNIIYLNKTPLFPKNYFPYQEPHNLKNLLASIACAIFYKHISINQIINRIKNIKNVQNRLEYIGNIDNLRIYNDAKSTNFLALSSAVNSFKNDKIILIVGGKKRNDDISLINYHNIVFVYCYGEMKDEFKKIFTNFNIKSKVFNTLKEVLNDIKNNLKSLKEVGNILLYSPAAQSYDQYDHFEARGEEFKSLIAYIKDQRKL